jgi:hypothetical protein
MYWSWWNLSCRWRCCLIYVQFLCGRMPIWTDDEDRDERCGDWGWRWVAWRHKLRDASEEFSACIFKVEGNPEGQQVPSKRMVEQMNSKVSHFKLLFSPFFIVCLNYLLFFQNSVFSLLHLLCLLSVILSVSSPPHTSSSSFSSSSSSSLATCPKTV